MSLVVGACCLRYLQAIQWESLEGSQEEASITCTDDEIVTREKEKNGMRMKKRAALLK